MAPPRYRRCLWSLPAIAGSAILLALPAHAFATNFYVDQATGSDSNGCTSPADACQTLGAGMGATSNNPGVNTLFVGPGTYEPGGGGFRFDSLLYDDLTVMGSGSGADPASDTIISQPNPGSALAIGDPTAATDGMTISHLRVTVPSTAPSGTDGVVNFGTNTVLQNVTLSMERTSGNGSTDFNSADLRGPMTFDHVTATTADPDSPAVLLAEADVTVRDSVISSAGSTAISQNVSPTTLRTLRIQRSTITNPGSSLFAVAASGVDLVLDSSVVTGGQAAVYFAFNAPGVVRHATLRNDTIDGGSFATWAQSVGNGANAVMTIDSSILLDGQRADHENADGSDSSITCTWSDVPAQVQSGNTIDGEIACPSGAANPNHNTFTSTLSDLFVNLAGGDYHLVASSPAIDSGSTDALAGDEATTDRDGNPRVLDGNVDCVARRDKGAYEFTGGQDTSTPAPQITAPGNALVGAPVSFAGNATDQQPVAALSFHWTFSDGATSNTQNTSHVFSAPGAQQGRLDVSDLCGHVGHAVKTISILGSLPLVGPTISGVSITNKVFAVGNLARKVKHGTRFLFKLSEPAAVKVVIEQPLKGRKAGGKCRKPSAKLRRKKACTRYARKGTLSMAGVQGQNSLAFTGKLKHKRLKHGRYRARFTAKDAAGNPSVNQPRLGFRIVRG